MEDAFWRTPLVRALLAEQDIGGLLRAARQRRGMRQAEVAAVAGYSQSAISRLEHNRRAGTDLDVLRSVAAAVGMPPRVFAAIVGAPDACPVTVATSVAPAEEDDPMRRRTLMTAVGLAVPMSVVARLDEALAVLPEPTGPAGGGRLAVRLARARGQFDGGHLARLIGELPDLLATAHRAAETADPAMYAQVTTVYELATDALSKVGAAPLSRITADRAVTYGTLSQDPVAMAGAARSLGIVLRHEGRPDLARRLTLDAANRLEGTGLTTARQGAAYARVLSTCAYNSAQAGDRQGATDLIGEAQRAVAMLAGLSPAAHRMVTAQVALYEVGVHWALGDAGRAVHVGRTLHESDFPTPERRARLHTDLARAWWQRGRPEETARRLLEAARHAPAEVRDRPAIREIAVALTRRHPRTAGVPELARLLARG